MPDTLAIDEDNVVHITIDEDKLLESSDETWEVERSTEIPPRKKISCEYAISCRIVMNQQKSQRHIFSIVPLACVTIKGIP